MTLENCLREVREGMSRGGVRDDCCAEVDDDEEEEEEDDDADNDDDESGGMKGPPNVDLIVGNERFAEIEGNPSESEENVADERENFPLLILSSAAHSSSESSSPSIPALSSSLPLPCIPNRAFSRLFSPFIRSISSFSLPSNLFAASSFAFSCSSRALWNMPSSTIAAESLIPFSSLTTCGKSITNPSTIRQRVFTHTVHLGVSLIKSGFDSSECSINKNTSFPTTDDWTRPEMLSE